MGEGLAAHFNIVLMFGIILIAGYIAGRVANFFRLPKVTGYIAAGVLLEPSFLGLLPEHFINNSTIISNFALCVITYAIGGSLNFSRIRKLGNTIWIMTIFESVITFLLISAGLFLALPVLGRFLGVNIQPAFYLPLAILAGSLGAPTDPTPTLAVKEEYKADGPVTTTILGIGAFDDAMGIIIFSIAIAVGAAVLGGAGASAASTIAKPLAGIFFSLVNGAIFALILLFAARKVQDKGVLVVMIFGALFSCFGVAQMLKLDELLSTMTLGCVIVNLAKDEEKFFISIRDYFEEMIFLIFFVVAGAHLQLNVLKSALWIVIVFVILRVLGKIFGAFIGAVISGAQAKVKKYTAFGLIPQGGIVVGLALLVKQNEVFSPISPILLNTILGTTVLFEFIGPLFTEVALKRSDEIGKEQTPAVK
ncbi:MAG: cation:proton antiporter [Candidatus Omnitrophota bacterium]